LQFLPEEKEQYEIIFPKVTANSKYALTQHNHIVIFDPSYILEIGIPKEGIPTRFEQRPERETIETNLFGRIDRLTTNKVEPILRRYDIPVQEGTNEYRYTSYYTEDCNKTMGGEACGLLQVTFPNMLAGLGYTGVDIVCTTQLPVDSILCDRIIAAINIKQNF